MSCIGKDTCCEFQLYMACIGRGICVFIYLFIYIYFFRCKLIWPLMLSVLYTGCIQACREATASIHLFVHLLCMDLSYIYFSVQTCGVYYIQTFECVFILVLYNML